MDYRDKLQSEIAEQVKTGFERKLNQNLTGENINQTEVQKKFANETGTITNERVEQQATDNAKKHFEDTANATPLRHKKRTSSNSVNIMEQAQRKRKNAPKIKNAEIRKANDEELRARRKNTAQQKRNNVTKENTGINLKLDYSHGLGQPQKKDNIFKVADAHINKKVTIETYSKPISERRQMRAYNKAGGDSSKLQRNGYVSRKWGDQKYQVQEQRVRVKRNRLVGSKTKDMSLNKYNKIYNPSVMRLSARKAKEKTVQGLKSGSKMMLEAGKSSVSNKMKSEEAGSGGKLVNAYFQAPSSIKSAVKSSKSVIDGTASGGRLICNTGKNVGKGGVAVVKGGIAVGKGTKRLAGSVRRNGLKGTAKSVGSNIASAFVGAPEKIRKKAGKVFMELARKLVTSILPFLLILIIIILVMNMLIMMISMATNASVSTTYMTDNNSILCTQDYLDELVEDWDWDWWTQMEELENSYIHYTSCSYGNNDKVILEIKCDDEDASVKSEYLMLYTMLAKEYDYQTNNLGVPLGNTLDANQPSADTLKAKLSEWFYKMNPIDSSQYTITQQTYTCHHGGKVSWEHDYTITTIRVTLMTPTELIASMGWDNSEIDTFNSLYGSIMGEGYTNNNAELTWKGNVSNKSQYDVMAEDVWVQYWDNNVPVLNITREEFANMVLAYCEPSGQIQYIYGGKNPDTGLDCSGFVTYMFQKIGINVGGGTSGIWGNTKAISPADVEIGDLVYKQSPSSNGINHIGIYVGGLSNSGVFAHCASGSGTVVNNYKGFVIYRRPLVKFADDVD